MPFDFRTPGAVDDVTVCWVMAAGGHLVSVVNDGGAEAILVWGDEGAVAACRARMPEQARQKVSIGSLELHEVLDICRARKIDAILPDSGPAGGRGVTGRIALPVAVIDVILDRYTDRPSPLRDCLIALDELIESMYGRVDEDAALEPDAAKQVFDFEADAERWFLAADAHVTALDYYRPGAHHAFRAAHCGGLALTRLVRMARESDPERRRELLEKYEIFDAVFIAFRYAESVFKKFLDGPIDYGDEGPMDYDEAE